MMTILCNMVICKSSMIHQPQPKVGALSETSEVKAKSKTEAVIKAISDEIRARKKKRK